MTFDIKNYPSLRKFGKTEREVFRCGMVVSEGLWSESVISMCLLDKQKVKKLLKKHCTHCGCKIDWETCKKYLKRGE